MGWFESGKVVEAILGDEPLDLTYDFLERLSETYREGCNRKPTLEEVRTLLEMVLHSSGDEFLSGLDERQVKFVDIKTEKKRKSQRYKQGDILAIPVGDGRYSFGRLMLLSKPLGMLLEVFCEISDRKQLRPSILASGRMFPPIRFLTVLRNGDDAIKCWRWTVVATDDGYSMADKDWALEFKARDPRGGWSAARLRNNGSRHLTSEEAEGMEPFAYSGPEDVEERIAEELKRRSEK